MINKQIRQFNEVTVYYLERVCFWQETSKLRTNKNDVIIYLLKKLGWIFSSDITEWAVFVDSILFYLKVEKLQDLTQHADVSKTNFYPM